MPIQADTRRHVLKKRWVMGLVLVLAVSVVFVLLRRGKLVDRPGAKVALNDKGEVKSLRLSGTAVSDADLVELTGFTALETLHLDATPVTDAGLVLLSELLLSRLSYCGIESSEESLFL